MIINLRGPHGAGKTWVATTFIGRYPSSPITGTIGPSTKEKTTGYLVTVPFLKVPLYIVGSYETATGGCDAIKTYDWIPRLLEDYFVKAGTWGHVLFEGTLISTNYGRVGTLLEQYEDKVVYAFLDTPLTRCVENVRKRQAAKGNTQAAVSKQVELKHRTINRTHEIMTTKLAGRRRMVWIDHRKAVSQVLGLLREGEGEKG